MMFPVALLFLATVAAMVTAEQGAKNPRATAGHHTQLLDQCVLHVMMTYGAETWTLTVGLVYQFKVAQRAMERAMLGVSLKDRIRNEVLEHKHSSKNKQAKVAVSWSHRSKNRRPLGQTSSGVETAFRQT